MDYTSTSLWTARALVCSISNRSHSCLSDIITIKLPGIRPLLLIYVHFPCRLCNATMVSQRGQSPRGTAGSGMHGCSGRARRADICARRRFEFLQSNPCLTAHGQPSKPYAPGLPGSCCCQSACPGKPLECPPLRVRDREPWKRASQQRATADWAQPSRQESDRRKKTSQQRDAPSQPQTKVGVAQLEPQPTYKAGPGPVVDEYLSRLSPSPPACLASHVQPR